MLMLQAACRASTRCQGSIGGHITHQECPFQIHSYDPVKVVFTHLQKFCSLDDPRIGHGYVQAAKARHRLLYHRLHLQAAQGGRRGSLVCQS